MKVIIAIIVTFAVTVALATGVAIYLKKGGPGGAKPTVVRLAKPERGELTEVVNARAEVEPKTKVEISARVSARIEELPLEEGDEVAKGDLLVRLDATDLEAALLASEALRAAQAAQIEVERARIEGQRAGIEGTKATLAQARRDLERQKQLFTSADISQSEVDATESRAAELAAQLAAAEHNLRASEVNLTVMEHTLRAADADIARARDRLSYTTIVAPMDGVITRIHAEEGETVIPGTMNNPGTVIMQVADLDKMLLVAQVDETDVGKIAVGQRAVAEIHAYPDEEFEGEVESIALTHDVGWGNTRFYKTEILLKLEGRRIFSGSNADVDIETKYHHDVLRVPSQAVLERKVEDLPPSIRDSEEVDEDKTFTTVVYRVQDGKAVVTPVKMGRSDDTHIVIESGLSEEDVVIIGPYKALEELKHEQKVKDEREVEAEKKAKEAEKKEKAESES